jgi:hypothetical protein
LIIERNGSVTWRIIEDRVRSTSTDEEDRWREETAFADAAATGNSEIAQALRLLGATEVECTLMRGRRPMTAVTRASFVSVDELAHQLLAQLDLEGSVTFDLGPEVQTLTITITFVHEDPEWQFEEVIMSLVDDLDDYSIALASGRFVAADGFELDSSKTVATPLPIENVEGDSGEKELQLSLSWRFAD